MPKYEQRVKVQKSTKIIRRMANHAGIVPEKKTHFIKTACRFSKNRKYDSIFLTTTTVPFLIIIR